MLDHIRMQAVDAEPLQPRPRRICCVERSISSCARLTNPRLSPVDATVLDPDAIPERGREPHAAHRCRTREISHSCGDSS